MSNIQGKVICPRCSKVHILPYPVSEVECTCHLFCVDGNEPKDCNVISPDLVSDYYSGFHEEADSGFTPAFERHPIYQLGYPFGAHGSSDGSDLSGDRLHAEGYCTVHKRYVYKDMLILTLDWDEFLKTRIPPGDRLSYWKR